MEFKECLDYFSVDSMSSFRTSFLWQIRLGSDYRRNIIEGRLRGYHERPFSKFLIIAEPLEH